MMAATHDELQIIMLASDAAPGLARTLIAPRLHKWGCSHISDDVYLIASELVTNASAATPKAVIKLRLGRDAAGILLQVWDSSDHVPEPRPAPALTLDTLDLSPAHWDDNGGWGLSIVATLAIGCGYRRDPAGGKWIWARLKP